MTDAPALARIAGHETLALGTITPHPDNARRGDTQRIERSLRDHGQYAALVVQQSTRHILKGNNTYRVMVDRLGWAHAEVTWVDCDDAQARAILAVDNRTSDGASYDDEALANLLESLNSDGLLAAGGYAQHDLDDLLAALEESAPHADPFDLPDDTAPLRRPSDVGIDDRKAGGTGYQESAVRSIMLTYTVSDYPAIVDGLAKLAARHGVDSTSELVRRMVEDAL